MWQDGLGSPAPKENQVPKAWADLVNPANPVYQEFKGPQV